MSLSSAVSLMTCAALVDTSLFRAINGCERARVSGQQRWWRGREGGKGRTRGLESSQSASVFLSVCCFYNFFLVCLPPSQTRQRYGHEDVQSARLEMLTHARVGSERRGVGGVEWMRDSFFCQCRRAPPPPPPSPFRRVLIAYLTHTHAHSFLSIRTAALPSPPNPLSCVFSYSPEERLSHRLHQRPFCSLVGDTHTYTHTPPPLSWPPRGRVRGGGGVCTRVSASSWSGAREANRERDRVLTRRKAVDK